MIHPPNHPHSYACGPPAPPSPCFLFFTHGENAPALLSTQSKLPSARYDKLTPGQYKGVGHSALAGLGSQRVRAGHGRLSPASGATLAKGARGCLPPGGGLRTLSPPTHPKRAPQLIPVQRPALLSGYSFCPSNHHHISPHLRTGHYITISGAGATDKLGPCLAAFILL